MKKLLFMLNILSMVIIFNVAEASDKLSNNFRALRLIDIKTQLSRLDSLYYYNLSRAKRTGILDSNIENFSKLSKIVANHDTEKNLSEKIMESIKNIGQLSEKEKNASLTKSVGALFAGSWCFGHLLSSKISSDNFFATFLSAGVLTASVFTAINQYLNYKQLSYAHDKSNTCITSQLTVLENEGATQFRQSDHTASLSDMTTVVHLHAQQNPSTQSGESAINNNNGSLPKNDHQEGLANDTQQESALQLARSLDEINTELSKLNKLPVITDIESRAGILDKIAQKLPGTITRFSQVGLKHDVSHKQKKYIKENIQNLKGTFRNAKFPFYGLYLMSCALIGSSIGFCLSPDKSCSFFSQSAPGICCNSFLLALMFGAFFNELHLCHKKFEQFEQAFKTKENKGDDLD